MDDPPPAIMEGASNAGDRLWPLAFIPGLHGGMVGCRVASWGVQKMRPDSHMHGRPARSKLSATDKLWKLFDDWADQYAKVNRLDKDAVISQIAHRHEQLSKKLKAKQDVELF